MLNKIAIMLLIMAVPAFLFCFAATVAWLIDTRLVSILELFGVPAVFIVGLRIVESASFLMAAAVVVKWGVDAARQQARGDQ